ncbi:MAG: hypothetical protein R3F44_05270 [Candidatus Competibacteraceae bacterium]
METGFGMFTEKAGDQQAGQRRQYQQRETRQIVDDEIQIHLKLAAGQPAAEHHLVGNGPANRATISTSVAANDAPQAANVTWLVRCSCASPLARPGRWLNSANYTRRPAAISGSERRSTQAWSTPPRHRSASIGCMAYPVPNIEQWVYGMKPLEIERQPARRDQAPCRAASHHLAGGAGARAASLSETVDHDHDAFRMRRDVLEERPASRNSGGELEPDSIRIHSVSKADNRGRYQFGREIFDAARQEQSPLTALRQGPPRDKPPR